jgi:hypothetical protein
MAEETPQPAFVAPTPPVAPIGAEPLLQFFVFAHLRADLQPVSQAFAELAHEIANTLPRNPERTVALRKLLEAKDCAVRALLYKHAPGSEQGTETGGA